MKPSEQAPVRAICAALADALSAQFPPGTTVETIATALRDGKLAISLLRFVFRVAALDYAVRVGSYTADIRLIAARVLESNGGCFGSMRQPGED